MLQFFSGRIHVYEYNVFFNVQAIYRYFFNILKVDRLLREHNCPNHKIWTKKAPGAFTIIENYQTPQSVMVLGGTCASSKTSLLFLEEGFEMNNEVYCCDLLEVVYP